MNKDVPPKVYEFTRVVFGVNASPDLAQLVAQHNAKVNSCELPRAAETVCESTYMDDSLDSVETIEEAVKLHHDLTTLWKRAGMTPKKWLSNSEEVLKVIPKDHRVNSLDLEAQVMPVIKTLGISWESSSDQFTFVVHPPPDDFFLTKRSFLSRTSTLFDPLGFVSPFTVRARMMLQAMWTAGLTWDQKLPAELAKGALTWFKELPALSRIKIPRSLKEPEQVADSQLHVFTDASQEAYGAVAYLRHEYQSGNTTVRFVMSKAKVTPLQSISVPRLELMTAIVGAEGLINSRPITYQSSNADDAEPLTPNHFLFNQVGGQFAPESVDTEPFNPRVRWRHVQEVVRHFWKRWLREWLPSLSPRKKWGKEKRDLGVGDLVLVLSTDTPRGKWPLGRIIEVFPGPDGHVRTADVKVKGSILRRPIVKLCPLECEA